MLEKLTFLFFKKNCPHRYFLYFYSKMGTLWSTTGTNFSQVPVTILNRMFLFFLMSNYSICNKFLVRLTLI